MREDTETKINTYLVEMIANKPSYIETTNSYERFCVYSALEKYANCCGPVWCNKSYNKCSLYANKTICKRCMGSVKEYDVEEYETYCGGYTYYLCNKCNRKVDVWYEDDFMYILRYPYRINIYYDKPTCKVRCFFGTTSQYT